MGSGPRDAVVWRRLLLGFILVWFVRFGHRVVKDTLVIEMFVFTL